MTREPGSDSKSVWQNQTTEGSIMPLEEVRDKARRLEYKVLRRSVIFITAFALHVLVEVFPYFFGFEPSLWLGLAGLSTFIVWVVYYPYVFASQHGFITLSTELAVPGLAFYRKQLQSLTDDYPAKLQVAFIAYYVVVHAVWNPAVIIPIGTLGGFWAYYSRRRESDSAKRELQTLVEFQRQNENTL